MVVVAGILVAEARVVRQKTGDAAPTQGRGLWLHTPHCRIQGLGDGGRWQLIQVYEGQRDGIRAVVEALKFLKSR